MLFKARRFPWSLTPVAAIAAAMAWLAVPAMPEGRDDYRQLATDAALAALTRDAGPDDLIIVASFWLLPSFQRLYRGRAEWNVLPLIPIDAQSRMTYGLQIKKHLEDERAVEPALDKAGRTLRAGHRVWYVVWPGGYSDWAARFDQFLGVHAARRAPIQVPVGQPVCALEDVSLIVAEGWN